MAKILIISGSYFPYATANAVCMKKFEDTLREQGHKIIYCNRKHDLYEPDFHVVDGTEIYTVGKNSDLFFQTVERLRGLPLPNGMQQAFQWAMKGFQVLMKLKNLGKGKSQIRSVARDEYLSSYAKKIQELIEKENIDLIISVSMPFDSHCAVLRALKDWRTAKRPKWLAYCIDAYWSKAGVATAEIPLMKAEEREIFEACDSILFLDTIEKDYSRSEFEAFRGKITALPLPLFDLHCPMDESNAAEGITVRDNVSEIVYTGTVYDDFSNADACIGVAEALAGENVRFHFLGKIYPKSLNLFKAIKNKLPDQIEIYGRMPYSYAKGSMQKADILLNLANDNSNQIPSKIFEYMMTLKPILNIYSMNNDIGTAFLKKYPLAFNFYSKENIQQQIEDLKSWLKNIQKYSINIDELDKIYHDVTTLVVCNNFIKLIEKILLY